MKSSRVMVVDDDKEIRESFVDALEVEGYEVLQAGNGEEAIGQLQNLSDSELPCLIILDWMMPVKNGEATFTELKASDRLSKIPVLVASARGSLPSNVLPPNIQTIKKPLELEQLYAIVASYASNA